MKFSATVFQLCVIVASIVALISSVGAQQVDTFAIKKTANTTFNYQSVDGLQRGFSYAFGDSFLTGYKTKNLPNYTSAPVILHAPNNRTFIKFGARSANEELVFQESKHSKTDQNNKQVVEFEVTAPDHQFSYVEFLTNDPNFTFKTEVKENYILAKFIYTSRNIQQLVTLNAFGYHKDRLPSTCFLFYFNCQLNQ